MNQEMLDYIRDTPIEEIIRREDFVQLTKESLQQSVSSHNPNPHWIVTLVAKQTKNIGVYETAWGTFVQSRHYLFYKEIK